jgi:hypothetical protein
MALKFLNDGYFAGSVGIGTLSPLEKLDVRGDMQMYNSYASGVEIKMSHVDPSSGYDSSIIKSVLDTISPQDGGSSMLRFYTNQNSTTSSTVALDLTRSQNAIFYGNVGIGTTSPGTALQVGDGTADDTIRTVFSDGSYTDVHGYGLYMSRTDSYIRPVADETQTLRIGDNGKTWNSIIHNANLHTFNNDASEWMRITSTGNVGIGTTSPNQKLHVNGATQLGDINATTNFNTVALKVVEGTISTGPTLGSGTVGAQAVLYSNGAFGMYTGVSGTGNTWMQSQRNDANTATYNILLNPLGGNVGIGVTNPSARLHVDGTVRFSSSGDRIFIADGSFGTFELGDIDGVSDEAKIVGNGSNIIISNTGTETLTCSGNNRVGIGTTSPQSKLDVSGGDIEVKDIASGVIMKSPNGTRYRVTIANGGTLVVTAV